MTRAELLLELTGVIQAAQRADETARALEAAEAERDQWKDRALKYQRQVLMLGGSL